MILKIVAAVVCLLIALYCLGTMGGRSAPNPGTGQPQVTGFKPLRAGCGAIFFILFACIGGSVVVSLLS